MTLATAFAASAKFRAAALLLLAAQRERLYGLRQSLRLVARPSLPIPLLLLLVVSLVVSSFHPQEGLAAPTFVWVYTIA